jgi:ribosomal protein L16/L10AE
MWRNSPRSSSSVYVQALKDLMMERKNSDEEIQSCMHVEPVVVSYQDIHAIRLSILRAIKRGMKILWIISFMYITYSWGHVV